MGQGMSMPDATTARAFRLGLIINPVAGLGGPAGLKGSDRQDTAAIAAERGVTSKVFERVTEVLSGLLALSHPLHLVTAAGPMGEQVCRQFPDIQCSLVFQPADPCSAQDTREATRLIQDAGVDLLLFAGGDGTARDVCAVVGADQAVLGLPAGVKMHSGVFAITPKAAVSVIDSLIRHRLVAARMAEVRDIDEEAFSRGRVQTRYFGEMLIPDDQLLVQSVKCTGLPDDELMLDELAAYLLETRDDDAVYVLGSGGTMSHIKQVMGVEEPTLLGVDVVFGGQVLALDVHEKQLFELLQDYPKARLYLSIIGGQGIVLGRGNQQISPRILRKIGLENLQFVSTQQRLKALEGRPLCVDSGNDALDRELAGYHQILTGYEDAVLYEVCYAGD